MSRSAVSLCLSLRDCSQRSVSTARVPCTHGQERGEGYAWCEPHTMAWYGIDLVLYYMPFSCRLECDQTHTLHIRVRLPMWDRDVETVLGAVTVRSTPAVTYAGGCGNGRLGISRRSTGAISLWNSSSVVR